LQGCVLVAGYQHFGGTYWHYNKGTTMDIFMAVSRTTLLFLSSFFNIFFYHFFFYLFCLLLFFLEQEAVRIYPQSHSSRLLHVHVEEAKI
jgi:hypothetical protein